MLVRDFLLFDSKFNNLCFLKEKVFFMAASQNIHWRILYSLHKIVCMNPWN